MSAELDSGPPVNADVEEDNRPLIVRIGDKVLDVCHKLLGSKKISFPLQLEKRSSNIEILIGTLMI